MANKILDENGLAHFWGKIKSLVSGKQDELEWDSVPTQDSTNPVTSHGIYTALQNVGGNGGGEDEVVLITGTIDLSTLQLTDVSHTYTELVALIESRKTVKFLVDYTAGVCYGDLVAYNRWYQQLMFQIMLQGDIGFGFGLHYLNVSMFSDGRITVTPYLVETIDIGS